MNPLDLVLGAGGATGAIVFLISAAKKAAPKLIAGREQALALILGLLASTGTYLAEPSRFQPGWKGWLTALSAGIALGIAAGVAHDKALNPLIGKEPGK